MPRAATPLTEARIRTAKPDDYPLWDSLGLYLVLGATGDRHWRLKYYRPNGKENRLGLGSYPKLTLAKAREKRDELRVRIKQGIDPAAERAAAKAATRVAEGSTFEGAAESWFAYKAEAWAEGTTKKARWLLDTHLIPALGKLSVATLSRNDVKPTLAKLAKDSPEVAVKAVQYVAGIVRKAQHDGVRDESRALLLSEILLGQGGGNIPAVTEPNEITALMKAIDGYSSPVTRAALLMAAYTAQRPTNIVTMRWAHLRGNEWHIPGDEMKVMQRLSHIVPLPRQAEALIESMRLFSGGHTYVFPPQARQKSPHLHRDALSKALRDLKFAGKHATHGFRAMLRTAGRERLGIETEILEAQLAHAKRGKANKAYDRTVFNDARVKAMQRWADYLDRLRDGNANVTAMKRQAKA